MRVVWLVVPLFLAAAAQPPAATPARSPTFPTPSPNPRPQGSAAPYDLVIVNGHVIDGTGSPWYAADVAIRDGRIAAIGRLAGAAAKQTIDAQGKIVAPGFIDMLGQSELTVLVEPTLPSKIFQGITTEITGEGGSAAPLNDAIVKADKVDYDHLKIT
ncbi:MAG TPA: hypothetical protein VN716_12160, partial [Vicinamibacterales bacterium]|nr:hypothetical protein [Vicinamibacterales bacterium]